MPMLQYCLLLNKQYPSQLFNFVLVVESNKMVDIVITLREIARLSQRLACCEHT